MAESFRPRIVVGVDGSRLSIDALRWAIRHARLIGAEIEAVLAWEIPMVFMPAPSLETFEYEDEGQAVIHSAVDEVAAESADVPITATVMRLQPRVALVQAAQGAHLLVVGSHGVGSLPGLHLGSVASYVVHHAPCPVLVYRTADTGR